MPKVKLQRENHVSAQYIQPKLPTLQTIEHCAGIFFIKIGPIHNGGEKTETSFRQVQFWKKNDFAKLCIYDRVIVANYAKSMMG